MHGTPILNVYGIKELTASFYNAYNASSYPEILTKTNRPYDVIVFETHYDYYVCVPFRTRLADKKVTGERNQSDGGFCNGI